jgi:hypothetical protein
LGVRDLFTAAGAAERRDFAERKRDKEKWGRVSEEDNSLSLSSYLCEPSAFSTAPAAVKCI